MQTMLAMTVSYLIFTLKSVLAKRNPIVRLAGLHAASSGPAPELALFECPARASPVRIRNAKSILLVVLLVALQQKLFGFFLQ